MHQYSNLSPTLAAKETPRKNGGGHRPIIKNAATAETTAIDMEVVNGNPVVSTSAAVAAGGSCGLDVDDTFTAIASRDVSGAAGASGVVIHSFLSLEFFITITLEAMICLEGATW